MKKITLSAAILALTMMGCSVVGLDNSVASTSEVKDEQVQSLDEKTIALFKTVETSDCFDNKCRIINTIGGHHYYVELTSNVDGLNQGFGAMSLRVDEEKRVTADFAHVITACVQKCDANGNCQYSDVVPISQSQVYFYNDLKVGGYVPGAVARCKALSRDHGTVGVVSVYSVVFNAGKSDEVILQGATRANLSYDKALKVYRKYIMPLQLQ